ncbi:hypothetical protein [Spongiivirga citrea]|uniref:Fibronectin type-III domain-containing protein n=1 Tax=Spongiivirga citrea TaxID=1481457 RepID=A0A6M0CMS9_9FLAO|nr:hypothetical protein [Spongiivirga citrea]NER16787.1 hypothetical protein [Spongiivirga citrea]
MKGPLKIVIGCLLLVVGCKDILNVEDISEAQVNLIAPINGTSLGIDNINFSWEGVEFAEGYRLQLITPNFEAPLQLVQDTLVNGTNFTLALPPGEYSWKVRAENSAFASGFSETRQLQVTDISFANRIVTLVSPSDNFNTNTEMQTLTWQEVPTAMAYNVQILDNANTLVKEESVTTTSFNNTFTEGTFNWQVQAINGSDTTAFSTHQIIIDLTVPSKPVATQPADDSTTTQTAITFAWTRMDVPGSTERDSVFVYSDNLLQNLVVKDEGTDKSFSATLDLGQFYWVVKAYDDAGNESEQSDTMSFTIN